MFSKPTNGEDTISTHYAMKLTSFYTKEKGFLSDNKNPVKGAIATMRLFKKYHGKPDCILKAKALLASTPVPLSFAKTVNYRHEGVCLSNGNSSNIIIFLLKFTFFSSFYSNNNYTFFIFVN